MLSHRPANLHVQRAWGFRCPAGFGIALLLTTYTLGYPQAYMWLGEGIGVLASGAALFAGWYWGRRPGALAGLLLGWISPFLSLWLLGRDDASLLSRTLTML